MAMGYTLKSIEIQYSQMSFRSLYLEVKQETNDVL